MIGLIKLKIIVVSNIVFNYILVARIIKGDWIKIYIKNIFIVKRDDVLEFSWPEVWRYDWLIAWNSISKNRYSKSVSLSLIAQA